MNYIFDENFLFDEWVNKELLSVAPTPQNDYLLTIYNKDFVIKKAYSLGSPDCVIEKIKYSESEKGSLNATITVKYLEVFLEYGDFIVINFQGNRDYIGYVVEIPDISGGNIKVNSLLNRCKELLYTGDFTDQTKTQILNTVISSLQSDSKINFASGLINFTDVGTYSPSYYSEKLSSILEEWAETEADTFWGINSDAFLYVKKRDTTISQTIYPSQYEKFDYTKNYDSTEYTRVDLYIPQEDDDDLFISQIPDGSTTYPYFDIEDIIGVKVLKLVAADSLSEAEAKEWAYGEVQSQILPETKLVLSGLDNTIKLKVGQKARVFLPSDYDFLEDIDTESLDNWTGDATLSTDAYDGTYSILVNGTATYTFPVIKNYADIKKIILFCKGGFGNVGTISNESDFTYLTTDDDYGLATDDGYLLISEDSTTISLGNININISDAWNYIELDLTEKKLKAITFNLTNCKIDFIHFFAIGTKYYDVNVVERSIDISNGSIDKYDVTFGVYQPSLFDLQFKWNKEIENRSNE